MLETIRVLKRKSLEIAGPGEKVGSAAMQLILQKAQVCVEDENPNEYEVFHTYTLFLTGDAPAERSLKFALDLEI